MVTSYNGWLASKNPADFGGLDNRVVPGTQGVKLAPGVRAGDVATVLFYVASQLDARVEDGDLYTPGDEWGFYFKTSANSKALISCHSSGTAFDWNATRHPNGKRGTFSAAQVAEIRRILAEVDNVVYWGGDARGNGTPDEMHFEIKEGVTAAQVAAVAAKLAGVAAPAPAAQPAVPAPAPAAPVSEYSAWENRPLGSRVLQKGCAGSDVADWQRVVGVGADGYFGDGTKAATIAFQSRTGAVGGADGIVGSGTLGMSVPTPKTAVASFQRWYNAYNFTPALLPLLKVDGVWGPKCTDALKKVQARYLGAAGADGIPGPVTMQKLYELGWRG